MGGETVNDPVLGTLRPLSVDRRVWLGRVWFTPKHEIDVQILLPLADSDHEVAAISLAATRYEAFRRSEWEFRLAMIVDLKARYDWPRWWWEEAKLAQEEFARRLWLQELMVEPSSIIAGYGGRALPLRHGQAVFCKVSPTNSFWGATLSPADD
jgi:hypothetical protein